MEYVVRALGFLLIPVIVSGLLAVLRQPKKAKKGKVYLHALLAIIGIIGCTAFLIPTLITAFTEETPWISLAFLAFSLFGASFIVAFVNCRVSYDQDGFVAKNFFGIKRKYTYDQVTAIKEGMHENYLYVGKRRIMIDEFAIGGAEFIGFVAKKYRAIHDGRALPVIRKTKGDIFNGNVEDVFGFMFAYISVGVLILIRFTVPLLTGHYEGGPKDPEVKDAVPHLSVSVTRALSKNTPLLSPIKSIPVFSRIPKFLMYS